MATGTAVSTGDLITAAKMNLKQETGVDLANLSVVDQSGAGSFALAFVCSETLTADRNLTITVNDAARTVDLGGNLTLSGGALTLTVTATTNVTLPTTGTLASLAGTETLTNKTLTSPTIQGTVGAGTGLTLPALTLGGTVTSNGQSFSGTIADLGSVTTVDINGGTADGLTSLGIRSTGTGAFDLVIANTENLTAGRTLTVTLNDAARTIDLAGNLTLAGAFTTSGAYSCTLTLTANSNVTLPTTGTLAVLGANTFTGAQTISGNVDTIIQAASPVIDIGADVLQSGTIIDFQYDTAETLAGAALVGVSMNMNTNLTYVGGQNVTAYTAQTAGFTNAAAAATVITGYQLPTAGALVMNNAGGSLTWYGADIQMPNITQTAGTMTAVGLRIVEGTVTSGTSIGISVNAAVAIDLVTNGNRIDFDTDNDTSLRASADDVLLWEIAATDRLQMSLDTGNATGLIKSAGATEIGFCVTNGALTVGSEGSVVIPVNAGVGTDGAFGDLDGAIGFDLTNNTIEVRDTTWLSSAALTGFGIQSFVPWVWHGLGFYHPNQMTGVRLANSQGIEEEYVDETVCAICGEHMVPGDHESSRAISMYPNAWLREGEPRRQMLHNIFGHTHPEREPVIQRMMAMIEALAQRLGFSNAEEALQAEGLTL